MQEKTHKIYLGGKLVGRSSPSCNKKRFHARSSRKFEKERMNEGGLANLFDKTDFSRVNLVYSTLRAKNPDRVIQKKEKGN